MRDSVKDLWVTFVKRAHRCYLAYHSLTYQLPLLFGGYWSGKTLYLAKVTCMDALHFFFWVDMQLSYCRPWEFLPNSPTPSLKTQWKLVIRIDAPIKQDILAHSPHWRQAQSNTGKGSEGCGKQSKELQIYLFFFHLFIFSFNKVFIDSLCVYFQA